MALQGCAADWVVIRSPSGWQAEFPGQAVETTTVWMVANQKVSLPSRILLPPTNSLVAVFKPGFYSAGGGTFPAVNSREAVDRTLRDFAAGWCSAAGVKTTQQRVTWADATTAELHADLDNGRALQLRAIVGKKGFMAFALTMNRPAAVASAHDGRRFLQSLAVD